MKTKVVKEIDAGGDLTTIRQVHREKMPLPGPMYWADLPQLLLPSYVFYDAVFAFQDQAVFIRLQDFVSAREISVEYDQ